MVTVSGGPEVESDRDRVAWGLGQDSDLAVVWGVCSYQMMYRAAYLEVTSSSWFIRCFAAFPGLFFTVRPCHSLRAVARLPPCVVV